jgi:starch synthase
VVVDQTTGTLVPYDPQQANDPTFVADFEAKFAEAINTLTRDPQLAKQYGTAGRKRCIEEFSWSKIAAETVAVYEKAIAWQKARK